MDDKYYELLARYFEMRVALRQVLSIYDGDIADAEKAKAVVGDARRLLDGEQEEAEALPFTDWLPGADEDE